MRRFRVLAGRSAIGVAISISLAACGSSASSGPPASASAPIATTPASPGSSGGSGGAAHTTAIAPCSLLDEAAMSTLAGFPAKFFGPGDPVARVPIADRAFTTASGASIRIAYCGYWETGVKAELSRDVSVQITQGDPAKPGSWSSDAAHGQFALVQTNAAAKSPQAVVGLGDEAFSSSSNGTVTLTVRAGDVIIQVEADAPPGATALTVDAVKGVAQAVLAKL